MKIATWNVNSLNVRLPQVLDWLQHPTEALASAPDVLVLQETKTTDDKFPHQAFTDAGYHAQWFGQKTYNGVALLSRQPATEVVRNIPGFDDDMARVICGGRLSGCRVMITGMIRWLGSGYQRLRSSSISCIAANSRRV